MLKGIKVGLLAGTALSLTGLAAADGGDIEERIAALEAMVAELKAELAEERAEVEAQFQTIDQAGILPAPIVTRVLDKTEFYEAEGYHQNYYQKNPARYKLYRVGCGRDKRVAKVWAGEGRS